MSKRLQIIMSDEDWQHLRQTARRQNLTVSEWARRALAAAWRSEPSGDIGAKLRAVREAASHDFPAADIGHMLEEIERGYRAPEAAG